MRTWSRSVDENLPVFEISAVGADSTFQVWGDANHHGSEGAPMDDRGIVKSTKSDSGGGGSTILGA